MRVLHALLVASFVTLALAGCTGSTDGLTAKSAVSAADAEATTWAADAALLQIIGVETHGLNESTKVALGMAGQADDAAIGDGVASHWYVSYFSAASGKRLVVEVSDNGTNITADAPLAAPADANALATARADWSVDSAGAIQAARDANASLDAALASGPVVVLYGLNLENGEWTLYVDTADHHFDARVNATSAELVSLTSNVRQGFLPVLPDLPAEIHETGSIEAAFDPLNVVQSEICTTPTAQCVHVPFTTNASVSLEATLAWGVSGNDFDLYLYQDGTMVSNDGINSLPPGGPNDVTGTSQVMHADIEPGQYEFIIVPWNAAADTWTLDVTFTRATA